MDDQPYRMPFGKYKGQTLEEVPASYRAWLISQGIYVGKDDLKAALINGNYMASTNLRREPASATPPKKRRLSATDPGVPPIKAKKLAISQDAKRNGTMLNYDGTAYISDFGKHAGQKLRDVPKTYVDWLISTNVYEKRPDLAAALREEGLLVDDYSCESSDLKWRAPSIHEADSRFHESLTQAPLWISDTDASRYFRLGEPLLSAAGVHLVSDAELKRSTSYGVLLTFP